MITYIDTTGLSPKQLLIKLINTAEDIGIDCKDIEQKIPNKPIYNEPDDISNLQDEVISLFSAVGHSVELTYGKVGEEDIMIKQNNPLVVICQGDTNRYEFDPVRKRPIVVGACEMDHPFAVSTKEGIMKGKAGDFLIRGVEGELYPCDRAIFEKTYEIVSRGI